MRKIFRLQFDTTKNTLFSVLKLVGLALAGLTLLSAILVPFINTEVDNTKNAHTKNKQAVATKREDTSGVQQAAKDEVDLADTKEGVSMQIQEATGEDAADSRPTDTEQGETITGGIDENTLYEVVRVVDGDTIDVSIGGKNERIRVIGLNTPETVDPRRTVECFGLEATSKAQELLLNKQVRLEADPTQGERDTYGRLLRFVFLEDGQNYGLEMISQGYGREYTYSVPHKYQREFQEAQKAAENAQRGLWAPDACAVQGTEDSEATDGTASEDCHAAYEPCLPIVDDLNCSDVQGPIIVKSPGVDPYRLDRDNDGMGCESS